MCFSIDSLAVLCQPLVFTDNVKINSIRGCFSGREVIFPFIGARVRYSTNTAWTYVQMNNILFNFFLIESLRLEPLGANFRGTTNFEEKRLSVS